MIQAVGTSAVDPGAFQGFLTYGPLGLAGLTFVLVVTALSFRTLNPATASLLRLVLFVGAFCFVAAPPADYSKLRSTLRNTAASLSNTTTPLKEITDMASGAGCPGGGSGIAIPHGPDMASRSSSVSATIQGAVGNINSVVESLPEKN